jgi:hypothetical protein
MELNVKHPNLLDGLFPHEVARIRRANIGGKVGVGFAGGGGSSIGLKAAGLKIDFAMNHDAAAIAMGVTWRSVPRLLMNLLCLLQPQSICLPSASPNIRR